MVKRNNDLLDVPDNESARVFKPRHILWSVFFGGPAAGGFLLYINFTNFNRRGEGVLTLAVAGALTWLHVDMPLFSGLNLYTLAFTIGYLYLTVVVNSNVLGRDMDRHRERNGEYLSPAWCVLVVVIAVLVNAAVDSKHLIRDEVLPLIQSLFQ